MSIARKAAWDYASQIGMIVLSMLAGICISRRFGAEGKGVYFVVLLAVGYGAKFTNFGLRSALQYHVGKDPSQARQAHSACIVCALASSAVAVAAAFLFLKPVLVWLTRDRPLDPSQFRYLGWAALALPFSLYAFGWAGLLIGLGRIKALAAFNFHSQLAETILMLLILAFHGSLGALLACWALLWAARGAAMLAMLRDHSPQWRFDPRFLLAVLSYGARAFVGNFATNLMLSANKLAILAYGGIGGMGIYTQADSYSQKCFMQNEALERGAFQSVASASRADAARVVCRLTRCTLFLGLGVWLLGGAASSALLVLNGPEFVAGVPAMWLMMAGPLALGGSRMLAMFYSGQLGRPQIPSALAWVGAILNLAIVFPCAEKWGLIGAGATSLAFLLHFGLYVAVFWREMRRHGLPLRDLLLVQRSDFALFWRHARALLERARPPARFGAGPD